MDSTRFLSSTAQPATHLPRGQRSARPIARQRHAAAEKSAFNFRGGAIRFSPARLGNILLDPFSPAATHLMLPSHLRQAIDELWSTLWSAGISNPMAALEQVVLLLFLRHLEDLDTRARAEGHPSLYGPRDHCTVEHHPVDVAGADRSRRCPGHAACRWSFLTSEVQALDAHEHLTRYVVPWMRELNTALPSPAPRGSAASALAAVGAHVADAALTLPREKPELLAKAIAMVEQVFGRPETQEVRGEAFEYLLHQIKPGGSEWGQYWTPRHLGRLMAALLDTRPGETVADPAAGTGGFLLAAMEHARDTASGRPDPAVAGFDVDRTVARVGWMNLALHGVIDPEYYRLDALRTGPMVLSGFDVVLTNPPFGGRSEVASDLASNSADRVLKGSRDVLFLVRALQMLARDGRGAVLVPEGVLFGSSGVQRQIRQELLLHHRVEGVVSLPQESFQPYASVKTSILVFRRGPVRREPGEPPYTSAVWFYEVEADGYARGTRGRAPTPGNDLWDLLAKWSSKPELSLEYFQPAVDIGASDYDGLAWVDTFPTDLGAPSTADQLGAWLTEMYRDSVIRTIGAALAGMDAGFLEPTAGSGDAERLAAIEAAFRLAAEDWRVDGGDPDGLDVLASVVADAVHTVVARREGREAAGPPSAAFHTFADLNHALLDIVEAFARPGADRRPRRIVRREEPLESSKCWTAPVRRFAFRPDWTSEDGSLQGSHDAAGTVRPEFVQDPRIYEDPDRWRVRAEFLDPECIEANGFNLSAARYRPASPTRAYPPPAELIRELREMELQLVSELDALLHMLGERA
jgi:type I restriction enzyme M protein